MEPPATLFFWWETWRMVGREWMRNSGLRMVAFAVLAAILVATGFGALG